MRAALYPSASKDDPKDAHLLLDILVQHRQHLRRLDADTVETRKLQMLVEDRRKLVDDQTAYSNQLRAKLKLYFPQAARWLPELHSRLAGEFLQRWPTLPSLQKARLGTIRRFFHQPPCRSPALVRPCVPGLPHAAAPSPSAP